jgi:EpsD family peptidyl-prolyl cis-trans isomerase
MEQRIRFDIVLVIAAITLLSGCKNDNKTNAPPSQVLARVNGDEITVNQLNYVLSSQKSADDSTRQQFLDTLVDQDILVQKAIELKLDRDPDVLNAIEFARRQVLAKAALGRVIGKVPEATPDEIKRFYADKPNLFEKRASYNFTTFVLPTASLTDAVKKSLNDSHTPAQTRAILQAANATFQEAPQHASSAGLPLGLVDTVAKLNPGDISVMAQGPNTLLLQLESSEVTPVSLKDATPQIQMFLMREKAQNLEKDKVAQLKSQAKVEYVRRFQAAPAAPVPVSEKVEATDGDQHVKSGMGLK